MAEMRTDRTRHRTPIDGEPRHRPAPRTDDRSIGSLLRELTSEGRTLMREEVELAKAEMSEKLNVFQRNMAAVAVGGAVLVAALVVLVNAMSNGMVALLEGWVGLETAAWLGPLLLAVVLAAVGWGLIRKGRNAIKDEGVKPRKTMATLEEDKRWAERKVQG